MKLDCMGRIFEVNSVNKDAIYSFRVVRIAVYYGIWVTEYSLRYSDIDTQT